MWEYLTQNIKADVNILVLLYLTCESTETQNQHSNLFWPKIDIFDLDLAPF